MERGHSRALRECWSLVLCCIGSSCCVARSITQRTSWSWCMDHTEVNATAPPPRPAASDPSALLPSAKGRCRAREEKQEIIIFFCMSFYNDWCILLSVQCLCLCLPAERLPEQDAAQYVQYFPNDFVNAFLFRRDGNYFNGIGSIVLCPGERRWLTRRWRGPSLMS